jgi:L-aminopeptidase/D-esterase-like protein
MRLTDALDPEKGASDTILVNAIALSGGSNYGLATASGVEQYWREQYVRKLGSSAKNKPIAFVVPAAIIYDMELGDWTVVPSAESGYKACLAAGSGAVAEGIYGVGSGATVGKIFSMKQAMKGGVGTSSITMGDTGVCLIEGTRRAVRASLGKRQDRTCRRSDLLERSLPDFRSNAPPRRTFRQARQRCSENDPVRSTFLGPVFGSWSTSQGGKPRPSRHAGNRRLPGT